MVSAFPSSQTHTFLSIPTEIRLRIYHYLFEGEQEDDCFLIGPHFGPWREGPRSEGLEVGCSFDRQDRNSMGRYPEILRANHQIYFEAFPVFYSSLGVLDPSKGTWRYKPLERDTQAYYFGEPDKLDSFDIVYDPPLMDGVTKPQNLDIFTKVLLIVKFELPKKSTGWRYDEKNGKLHSAKQQQLTDALCASKTIEDFVEILAGCAWVNHVDLDIGLLVDWEGDQQVPDHVSPTEDDEAARLVGRKEIWHRGDIQVADIFLASGILDPLKRLSNIRSWCIEMTMEDWSEEPPCMHQRMTLDLSNASKHKRTVLCNGHDSNIVPCGLMLEPLVDPLLYQTEKAGK